MHQLIELVNQQKVRNLQSYQIGIVVDLLYQYDFFHHLGDEYGKFYLCFLVQHNFIETYNLRKGRPLIDTKNIYILIEGQVSKYGFKKGTQISIQRDGQMNTLKDSIFLKIPIEKLNHQPKLKQLQKSINKSRFLIQLELKQNHSKKILSNKLKHNEIFCKLTKYDFNRIIYESELRTLFNGKKTHQFQKPIKEIIYIISGDLKLNYPFNIESNPKQIDQILQRYLIDRSKSNKKEISLNFSSGEWVGIDEHFSKIPHKSYGNVMSVEAQLLFIPVKLFDQVFNKKCNHSLFSNIEYIQNIRTQMLEKSLQTQIQKQAQALRWSNQQTPIPIQLKSKLSKYKIGFQEDEFAQNLQENPQVPLIKKRINLKTKKKTLNLSNSQILQKEKQTNMKNSVPVSLNKLQKKQFLRVNLFPQEYERQFVLPSQKREIDEAQKLKNLNLRMYNQPKNHRKVCQKKKNVSLNTIENPQFQRKLFSISKNISQNFALCSTFYRDNFKKGDDFCNLNMKTIVSIEPSRKQLLLRRKNERLRQMVQNNRSSISEFFLPGLRTKSTVKDFQPMNPQNNYQIDLSKHLFEQNYHIQSRNTLYSKHKQSSQTISLKNYSGKTLDSRQNSKSLFVKPEILQKIKESRTIDVSEIGKRSRFKRKSSELNIIQ